MSTDLIALQKEMSSSVVRHTKELVKGHYSQLTGKVLPVVGREISHLKSTGVDLAQDGFEITKNVISRSIDLAIEYLPEPKPSFEGPVDEAWSAFSFGATGFKEDKLSKQEYKVLSEIEISIMNNTVVKNIPQLPKIAPRLINALKEDSYPWTEFSIILREDEKFQKRFLTIANSPAFGLKAEAKTIEQLLIPLNKNDLKQAILITAISTVMEFDKDKYGKESRNRITETAFKTAIACKTLASDGFEVDEESAFITGLTYHVGAITALRIMRNTGFVTCSVLSKPFVKRLQQLIALMTYQIVLAWKLPKNIRIAIKEQAVLGENPKLSPLGEILFLASRVAMAHYLSSNKIIKDSRDKVAVIVGLDRLAVCETSFETLNTIQNFNFTK